MIEEKPALGIMPFYIAYDERINELSEAIIRCNDTRKIKAYAFEIVKLCNLIDDVRKNNEDLEV